MDPDKTLQLVEVLGFNRDAKPANGQDYPRGEAGTYTYNRSDWCIGGNLNYLSKKMAFFAVSGGIGRSSIPAPDPPANLTGTSP